MANPARGEVDLVIDGRAYAVRGSMSAIAEICDALGVESLRDFGARLMEFRPRDMLPMAHALLKANGHDLTPEAIDRGMDWAEFVRAMAPLFFAEAKDQKEADARPPKRPKAA
jgi:hypothetical protein